jgi:hypothetical protein
MAIPASGPLSMTTIQTEFGGTAPISLNEYYAGGSFVPAGTSGTFGAVPSSGTISIRNFYGTTNLLPRAIFAGGQNATFSSEIYYVNPSTLGNAVLFGYLTAPGYGNGGCGSSTRGVFFNGGNFDRRNTIDYVTFATTGNATTFGDMGLEGGSSSNACNSPTRGVIRTFSNVAQPYIYKYVTIATTGNSIMFGLSTTSMAFAFAMGSICSTTRGVFAGGRRSGGFQQNIIEYVTIATTGNATEFGFLNNDLGNAYSGSCSTSTRGIFAGGLAGNSTPGTAINTMFYITIATTGNTTTFGNLLTVLYELAGTSSTTRGLFIGGTNGGPYPNMQYITIATTGNSVFFGTLADDTRQAGATSNVNGGT